MLKTEGEKRAQRNKKEQVWKRRLRCEKEKLLMLKSGPLFFPTVSHHKIWALERCTVFTPETAISQHISEKGFWWNLMLDGTIDSKWNGLHECRIAPLKLGLFYFNNLPGLLIMWSTAPCSSSFTVNHIRHEAQCKSGRDTVQLDP